MNKNIINNAQLLEIKTKIRQLGAMMNAYQCRFVVSSGQLFFVDDEYAGNDLVGTFERYKDIADGDMEVAMNFIKEAYPFNEETESFIRKKFDMPMPDESKE